MRVRLDIKAQAYDWITQAINRAGGIAELAEQLGIKTSTVRSWVILAKPSLDHIAAVQKYLEQERSK